MHTNHRQEYFDEQHRKTAMRLPDRVRRALLLLMLSASVGLSCGQSGPLVLPEESKEDSTKDVPKQPHEDAKKAVAD